jgi:hypothetical protein
MLCVGWQPRKGRSGPANGVREGETARERERGTEGPQPSANRVRIKALSDEASSPDDVPALPLARRGGPHAETGLRFAFECQGIFRRDVCYSIRVPRALSPARVFLAADRVFLTTGPRGLDRCPY